MAISSRAKKRLILAAIVLLLGGVGLPGAYLLRRAQKSQSIEQALQDGLAAHERGDYEEAIKDLRYYVSTRRANDEANLALAQSLGEIAGNNRGKLLLAIDHAQRIVGAEHQLEAQSLVLDLYTRTGKRSESLQAAARLLELDPVNYDALAVRCQVLLDLRRWSDALNAAREFRAAYPADLAAQTTWFAANAAMPPESAISQSQILTEVETLFADNAEDLRFGMLRVSVLLASGQSERAVAALDEALDTGDIGSIPHEQIAGISKLLHALTLAQASADTRRGAREARDRFFELALASPSLAQPAAFELAISAWTGAHQDETTRYLKMAISPIASADTDALGWASLLGLADEAELGELETRSGKRARFWASLSEAARLMESGDGKAAASTLENTKAPSRDSWLVSYLIGEARMMRGDSLGAAGAFESSILDSPQGPWYRAGVRLAEALSGAGMHQRALQVATDTVGLSGDGRVSEVLPKSVAVLAEAGILSREYARSLTQALIQSADSPGVSPIAHAHRAGIYLALGREDLAIDAASRVLSMAGENDAGALAEASRLILLAEPDLASRLLGEAKRLDPDDALVVLAEASALARAGDLEGGLALLQRHIESAPSEDLAALERVDDRYIALFMPTRWEQRLLERAVEAPENPGAQLAALGTRAIWTDRESSRSAIDRLKKAVGESGLVWRTYEANWILTFAPERATSIRTELLVPLLSSQHPDSRVLMLAAEARLQEAEAPNADSQTSRLRRNEAIAFYERASAGTRPLPAIALRSIRMLQRLGLRSEARTRLQSLAQGSSLSTNGLRELAGLFENQGMFLDAAKTMAASLGPDDPAESWAQSARLWARAGDNTKAGSAYEHAMRDDDSPANIVVAAASFFSLTGDHSGAERLMASLEDRLDANDLKRAQAGFLARIGEDQRAQEILTDLAILTPEDTARLAMFFAKRDRLQELQTSLADGRARFPDDEGLLKLSALAASDLDASVNLAADASAVAQIVADQEAGRMTMDEAIDRLAGVLTRFPASQFAGSQRIEFLREEGRLDEALGQAEQLVANNGSQPSVARLAMGVAYDAGNKSAALSFAREWRRRSSPDTAGADEALASLRLELGGSRDSLAWARANRQSVLQQASIAQQQHVTIVAATLAASGAEDEARQIAETLAATDPQWSLISLTWLHFAMPIEAQRDWILWVEQLTPQSTDGSRRLAQAWFRVAAQSGDAGDYRRVVDNLTSFDESELEPSEHLQLASIYARLGELDEAAHWYEASIEVGPDNPIVLNNAAIVDVQRGKADARTLANITQALVLLQAGPHEQAVLASLLDTKGIVLLALDKPQQALETYDRALAIPLDEPKLDLSVGRIEALRALGKLDEARAVFAGLPTIDSDDIDPELRARIDRLASQI